MAAKLFSKQSMVTKPQSTILQTKPVFSRERFNTVTAYRGFVTKSQLLRDAVYTELIN